MERIAGYVLIHNLKPEKYVLYVRDKNEILYMIRISIYHTSKMNISEHFTLFDFWARQLSSAPISMVCMLNNQHLTIQLYRITSSAHVHLLLKSFYESLKLDNHIQDLNNPSYARVTLNLVSSLIVNDHKLPEEYDSVQG